MTISRYLSENVDLFNSILDILFQRALSDDCDNLWSISRPMFVLIVFNPEVELKFITILIVG
jgi:hypothetical protein